MAETFQKIQTQGVHHITIIGADRQTSIDFWEGVLGMPFIFDQPNLDNPDEGCDLDYVPHEARDMPIRNILKNSFGFGGHNACLVLSRFDG